MKTRNEYLSVQKLGGIGGKINYFYSPSLQINLQRRRPSLSRVPSTLPSPTTHCKVVESSAAQYPLSCWRRKRLVNCFKRLVKYACISCLCIRTPPTVPAETLTTSTKLKLLNIDAAAEFLLEYNGPRIPPSSSIRQTVIAQTKDKIEMVDSVVDALKKFNSIGKSS
ncbi:hypothetical protein NQ318_018109 [Aromia moschata]|uniref:Uncharacterized protein n=1 Tax=Aromia moschata TaxID=1265417 RepID=A0AAV8ZFK8_9CUCU|nr:hypothetical protein NQ318_018109 [Aromia moschata]